jgi:hypothetical protein
MDSSFFGNNISSSGIIGDFGRQWGMNAESKKPPKAPKLRGEKAALLDAFAVGILTLLQGQDSKQSLEAARNDRATFLKKAAHSLVREANEIPKSRRKGKKIGRPSQFNSEVLRDLEFRVNELREIHGPLSWQKATTRLIKDEARHLPRFRGEGLDELDHFAETLATQALKARENKRARKKNDSPARFRKPVIGVFEKFLDDPNNCAELEASLLREKYWLAISAKLIARSPTD